MAMKKKALVGKVSSYILPGAIILLLVVGTTLSVMQSQQEQVNRTRAATSNDCTVTNAQLAISTIEGTLFDSINTYRVQEGRTPLVWSNELNKAASWMSNDMLTHTNLSHIDSLGRDTTTRLKDCDVNQYATFAENIDSGTTDPQSILASWQHANSQNENLLNPSFKYAAVSLATDSTPNNTFWVATFGTVPISPTPSPTATPSATVVPTTVLPSLQPTSLPTVQPTAIPTVGPTTLPTKPFTPTNTPTPTQMPTPTIDPSFVKNPDDTQLFLTVKMEGIGTDGNRSPKHLSRKMQVTLFDVKNKPVVTGTGFIRYIDGMFRGIIHLGQVPNGTYYLKIMSEGTLTTSVLPIFQSIRNDRLNIIPPVVLHQGDITADNALTLEDFNIALVCFQDRKCDEAELLDFNDDEKTDITDYNLLLQSFWKYEGD